MTKADIAYDKRVFVIIGGGEWYYAQLSILTQTYPVLRCRLVVNVFAILHPGGAAMKAAETMREEGFKGKQANILLASYDNNKDTNHNHHSN